MNSIEKRESEYQFRKDEVYILLDTFPKSKNGQPYLRMRDGERVFFSLFLRKYGLDWTKTTYTQKDVTRRMQLFPKLKHFLISRNIEIKEAWHERRMMKNEEMKIILIKVNKKSRKKNKRHYGILSIYPSKKNNAPVQ